MHACVTLRQQNIGIFVAVHNNGGVQHKCRHAASRCALLLRMALLKRINVSLHRRVDISLKSSYSVRARDVDHSPIIKAPCGLLLVLGHARRLTYRMRVPRL